MFLKSLGLLVLEFFLLLYFLFSGDVQKYIPNIKNFFLVVITFSQHLINWSTEIKEKIVNHFLNFYKSIFVLI